MHARWVGCLEGCLGGARARELLLRGFGGECGGTKYYLGTAVIAHYFSFFFSGLY